VPHCGEAVGECWVGLGYYIERADIREVRAVGVPVKISTMRKPMESGGTPVNGPEDAAEATVALKRLTATARYRSIDRRHPARVSLCPLAAMPLSLS
jgi:hypothetical protein